MVGLLFGAIALAVLYVMDRFGVMHEKDTWFLRGGRFGRLESSVQRIEETVRRIEERLADGDRTGSGH